MQERSREASWTQATRQINRTFLLHLENFGKGLALDGLNRERLSAFIGHLRQNVGMEDSTVRKEFKILRAFLRWAQAAGYRVPEDAARFRPVFKMPLKPVVFLTRDELLTLYNFRIPPRSRHRSSLERARDLFCFCAFTGLRYSDMASIRRSDVVDGVLSVVTQKTNSRIEIRLPTYARAILDKYADKLPADGRALPVICNQRLNMHLKEVCRLCGFDTPVHVTRFRAGRREDVTVPKYSLITSHCGRRTFICLMLSIGIPPQVVMKFTGHSDYSSMKPYIDISEKSKADAIAAMEGVLGG